MKIGRNEPCPCGSGKKYKKCCESSGDMSVEKYVAFSHTKAKSMSRLQCNLSNLINPNTDIFANLSDSIKSMIAKSIESFDQTYFHIFDTNGECIFLAGDAIEVLGEVLNNHEGRFSIWIAENGQIDISTANMDQLVTLALLQQLMQAQANVAKPKIEVLWQEYKIEKKAETILNHRHVRNVLCLKYLDQKFHRRTKKFPENFGLKDVILVLDSSICKTDFKYKRLIDLNEAKYKYPATYRDFPPFPVSKNLGKEFLNYYIKEDISNLQYLANSFSLLHFVFSDNTILTGLDILAHPYGMLIPKDLLPQVIESDDIEKKAFYQNRKYNRTEHTVKCDQIFSIYLYSVLDCCKKNQITFSIGTNPYHKPRFYALANIENFSLSKSNLELDIEISQITKRDPFKHTIHVTKIDDQKNKSKFDMDDYQFIYDEKTQSVNRDISSNRNLHFLSSRLSSVFRVTPKADRKNINRFELTSRYFENMAPAYYKIIDQLKMDEWDIRQMEPDVIKEPQIDTVLNLLSKDADKINFKFKIQCPKFEFYLHGLPDSINFWLNLLYKDGLKRAFYKANQVASQGEKRKEDLLLLRHKGIFLLILHTFMTEILKFSSSESKEAFKLNLFNQLKPKIYQLLAPKSSNPNAQFLEEVISEKGVRVIEKAIDGLFDDGINLKKYSFFHEGKSYTLDVSNAVFSSLKEIFDLYLFYNPDAYTKVNSKDFLGVEDLSHTVSPFYPTLQNIAKHKLPMFCFKQIKNIALRHKLNFSEINIDDVSIEMLNANDLQTEINLGDDENTEIDWFELSPKVFFKGKLLSKSQMQQFTKNDLVEYDGKFYWINREHIPSLKWLDYFWQRLMNKDSNKKTFQKESYFPLPKSQVLEMLALRQAGIPIIGGSKWTKVCETFDNLSAEHYQKDERYIPKSLQSTLKEYQKLGVKRLMDWFHLKLGGIVADDMGLGKTLQVLTFLEQLRLEKNLQNCLIVVPTSLIYNWEAEAKKFTPDLSLQIFSSKNKKMMDDQNKRGPHIYITTYGLLANHSEFFNGLDWQIAIFDEAQNLKNITSERTKCARSLPADIKYCLTGTPMENNFMDFYSLMDLAVPGSLGDLKKFQQIYSFKSSKETIDSITKADIQFLKLKSKPLVLRRKKEHVLSELPEKTESVVKLPFEKKQAKIYKDIAISWNERIREKIESDKSANTQLEMLTALLRLRQVCSAPNIISGIEYKNRSPKIEVLTEALKDVIENNESALVFTNFLSTLKLLEKECALLNIQFYSISGGTSASKRKEILSLFNENSKPSILMMTLKTGGVGLNLTKANYVFHLEPWWNPAAENQGTDRAYRIGQEKHVHVYRYIMKESVEEKIETLKSRKSAAFNALFEDEGEIKKTKFSERISKEDFDYLIGDFS